MEYFKSHFVNGIVAAFILSSCSFINEKPKNLTRPNIILIVVDDLGYGDLSCYNEHSKINTPNFDRLASQGISFTDAHSSAAQCSPTRYGILTGQYSWRTRLKEGVLPHFDIPLIKPGKTTIASMLKNEGYSTACIGKWHLGLGWQPKEGDTINHSSWDANQNLIIDYSKPLYSSPNDYGFDYFYGINASNNMLPYCLIENNKVVNIPDTPKYPVFDTEDKLGLASSDYDSQELESILFSKAMNWLENQKNNKKNQAFFLYYPMSAIHRPCLPKDEFKNSSMAGLRGDKVIEVDDFIGKMVNWLDRNKLSKNTVLIVTSDNGARPGDQMIVLSDLAEKEFGKKYHTQKLRAKDSILSITLPYNKPKGSETYHIYKHFSSGVFKGYKSDIYEGGHRVPFIVRWPGTIKPGIKSNELISTIDFMATFADLLNVKLNNNEAEDSYSFLGILLDKSDYKSRPNLVHKAWQKDALAIRKGDWKLIPFKNGGGLFKFPDVNESGQLFNLKDDPGEEKNVYSNNPEIVKELEIELNIIKTDNRAN